MSLLILGGRSLIGQELIRIATARKEHVWELGRKSTGDTHIAFDVSDLQSISSSLFTPNLSSVSRIIFCHRYRPRIHNQHDLKHEIDTMVLGPMQLALCASQACPHLSNILFIGSHAAEYVSDEQPVQYHITRSALESMARHLAITLSCKNIAVNIIRLGYITNGSHSTERDEGYYQMDKFAVPRGFGASPEEVALVIDRFSGIPTGVLTGQVINLDAGLSLRSHSSLAEHLRTSLCIY